ncbi:acetyl CoA synthetase, partial [Thermococcus sp.]|uniref:acetyl CoA synthetase n=1 Tax=Thermococcus sp. TaxID=35749 RepID=UPI002632D1BD
VLPGPLALISQSGALGIALMGWTILEKVGLSAVVSIGNKSDIDDADLLEFFKEDGNTKAILIYMEGVKNGRRFLETARKVSKVKPIVIIKAGRSERGAKAAASHTGSLAGSDRIYDAAFKQSGVIRAYTIGEAFDYARALSNLPEPEGENFVIITNGGGIGVMATDAAEESGLHLYDDLNELKVFSNYMPPFGSYKNPVDLTGMAGAEGYEGAIREALRNPNMHSIAVLYCQTAVLDPRDLAEIVIREYNESGRKKPLVVAIVGGIEAKEAIDRLNEEGIPAYPEPDRAVKALAALYRWSRWKAKQKRE